MKLKDFFGYLREADSITPYVSEEKGLASDSPLGVLLYWLSVLA